MSDPYSILGVPRDATNTQIVETYRALAQIYHPDRYAQAPPRVRDEANKRMQELNAAYEALRPTPPAARKPSGRTAREQAQEPVADQPAPARACEYVRYVDGGRHYHSARVLPLGWGMEDGEPKQVTGAPQCGGLNAELVKWFQTQRANASMTDKLIYSAWDRQQQSMYAATMGSQDVQLPRAANLGTPCPECKPPRPR